MKFTAEVKHEDNHGVTLEAILRLLREDDRRRILGDLLMHSSMRLCTLDVWPAEGYKTLSEFINKFYGKAHEEGSGNWKVIFPCVLEFNDPMHGGLTLDFFCEQGAYPSYTGYSVNT